MDIYLKNLIQRAPCGTWPVYCFFPGTAPFILATSLVFM